MSDYTPTTGEVRDSYADGRVGIGEWTRFDDSVKRAVEEAYVEFDRMIAEVERAAAARALEEAATEWRKHVNGSDASYVCSENWLRTRAAEYRKGKKR